MKEELINYVMGKANECYADDFPIQDIEIWLREFFDQYQPERSKREDTFIYRPKNYPGPIAVNMKPSKECDEYHKNSSVQINIKSDAVL